MRNVMLSVSIMVILVLWCGPAFGKGAGKGAGRRKDVTSPKKAMSIGQEEKEQQAEKGKSRDRVEQGRGRERERERDRAREAKQERIEKAKEKGKKEIEDKVIGKGREHQQQLRAIEKQMRQNEAKHRRRVARLKRIQRLAAEEGNNEIVKRIDLLLEKERYRYEHKNNKMNKKMETVLQTIEKESDEESK